MQFHVPQFIDVEDKLFGPFTFKQFIYIVGGLGLSYLVYKFLGIFLAFIIVPPIIGLAVALTFVKINNKPFVYTFQYWIKFQINKFFFGNNLYVWRKDAPKKVAKKKVEQPVEQSYVPKLSNSKLKDISWGLDVLDVNKK